MLSPGGFFRTLAASTLLLTFGCATTTRPEPPPEVAPQPPEVMASEVIAEERAATEEVRADDVLREEVEQQVAEDLQAAQAPPPAAPVPTIATPSPVTTAQARQQAQRFRPPARSVEDIRSQRATAPPPLDFSQRLDYAHDRVYAWMQGVVERTDHRFAGDDEPLKPVPASPFRLGLVGEAINRSDGVKLDLEAQFDIALSLPNIEERLRIFVTSGSLDEAPTNQRETQGLRAGLRYPVLSFLDFDLGVRVDVPPVAFASLKWTREYTLGSWDFYPFAKVFAETKESVGYAAAATFDRWTGRRLLRTSTYAKWRADRNATQWSQTLVYGRANEIMVPSRFGSYIRASDIGRGWGLRLLAAGDNTRSIDKYEAGMFYRRPAPNRWMYWSVEPIVSWDREYNWSSDPGIRIGIEMLFWDLARPARR
jgi:hypothetical protein